ncbi:MAG: hypothetical protein QM820_11235 [Minicystis sp.]
MRPYVLICAAIAAAGCADGERLDPIPSMRLRVPGDHLRGAITVTVEAAGPDAFHGVELALRGERIGVALREPFAFTFDSAAFADGPAMLAATGVLARTGEEMRATAEVAIENAAPALQILDPSADAAIPGSPTRGFSFAPIVAASDGNGIHRIWAEIADTQVDLGAGDGSVRVSLPQAPEDLPGEFVNVTIHAADASGAESNASIYVAASNLVLQAAVPDEQPITDIRALPGGGALVAVGSPPVHGIVTDPSLDAKVLGVPDGDVGPVVRAGGDALFFRPDAQGLSFVHAADGAAPQTIFQLDATKATRAFGPITLSSGRVAVGWRERTTSTGHLALLTPGGAVISEAMFPTPSGVALGDAVFESPDGKLLVAAGASYLPIDLQTGAAGPTWPPFAASILLADRGGIVVRYHAPSPPNEARLAAYADTIGPPAWDVAEDAAGGLIHVGRAADGGVIALAQDTQGAELRRYGSGGFEVLWSAPGLPADLLSVIPESGDMLVRIGTVNAGFEVARLQPDGAVAWTIPVDIDLSDALPLADGSVVLAGGRLPDDAPMVIFLGPSGMRWAEDTALTKVSRVIEHDGLLVMVGAGDVLGSLLVESRATATGALGFRYHAETIASVESGAIPLVWSDAWGMILTGGRLAGPAPERPHAANALLGLLP